MIFTLSRVDNDQVFAVSARGHYEHVLHVRLQKRVAISSSSQGL